LLAAFVAERPKLVGLAYRITGSRVEAEDIVQEAWLRAQRAEAATIDRPPAWLTRVVARLALDHLRSARQRRESYVGPWLPEPVAGLRPEIGARPVAIAPHHDPAAAAELAESVTFGFLRVLETLAPVERVVFLLSDVFDVPFAEIAAIVDRSPEACRQVASRARRRVRAGDPRHEVRGDAAGLVEALFAAVAAGDVDRVVSLLADDAVLVSDGGPRAHAARRPVVGPDRIARFLVNLARRLRDAGVALEPVVLNGERGMIVTLGEARVCAMTVHVTDGAVAAIYNVVNPDKLAALDIDTPML
jgi:RNA polymerase sigma-70 factor (ECF subfamily)